MDWDNLGFALTQTDYMYKMKCSRDENFTDGKLSRYGNIELSPSAGVLNYGQVSASFNMPKEKQRKKNGIKKENQSVFSLAHTL
jgi:hypothetical protein